MKKTRGITEQIIRILREADSSEVTHEELCRKHTISVQTFYRWRSKYSGMDLNKAYRLGAQSIHEIDIFPGGVIFLRYE